ncbi:MAG: VCBS repeat-containing protein [Gammaproteobacteria bacterium]|nr:MAG: VCBS repeat-containing protein [Gammaproteobacteria bacterium]
MKKGSKSLWFIILLAAFSSVGNGILPVSLKEKIQSAGYLVDERSNVAIMPDGTFVLRAYKDKTFRHSAILLVSETRFDVVETRDAGGQIIIEPIDINADGVADLVISENFELEWSIRIYVNQQGFKKVFDGTSILRPEFKDFTGDGRLELIIKTDPYHVSYDPLFCTVIYQLRDGHYQPMPKKTHRPTVVFPSPNGTFGGRGCMSRENCMSLPTKSGQVP